MGLCSPLPRTPDAGLSMKEEVETGARFIARLVNRHKKLDGEQVECFGECLAGILCERFHQHWYPDNPLKGQAYRCIRINRKHHVDDSLLKACMACGLDYSKLALPREISIWIDPGEVCCRLGENNRYFRVKKEENPSGKSTPEPETSDYHSESPSENSEDESLARFSKTTDLGKTPDGKNSPKQAAQYFYIPAPLWVPCPQNVVSYIPAYQPLTFYYVDVPSKSSVPRKPNPNLLKRLTKRASKA
ncbi:protein BTG3-like isoform 1-T1 [Liasis olivaceus]